MELDAETKAPTTNQPEEAASAAAKTERELSPADKLDGKCEEYRYLAGSGWRNGCRKMCARCRLYTSDAADDLLCVDLGSRSRITT